jgi:hypothetical protein
MTRASRTGCSTSWRDSLQRPSADPGRPGGAGVARCAGTLPDGAKLPTGVLDIGSHTFTVTATDNVGNTGMVTHTYMVGLI